MWRGERFELSPAEMFEGMWYCFLSAVDAASHVSSILLGKKV